LFKNSVSTILIPVKIFLKFNLAENIIDSKKVSRKNLYWRASGVFKIKILGFGENIFCILLTGICKNGFD